jgi:hypothetical protein
LRALTSRAGFSADFARLRTMLSLRMPDSIRLPYQQGLSDAGEPAVAAGSATHWKLEQ